ncbi:MAG: hypothetical protein LC689_06665 [Myxococcales bacterium]|nr:hypothetical protein [Myxococcales bacterium]
MGGLLLIAALLAQSPQPAPPPDATQARADREKPLSQEDRELVKELALLEQMELVKNLDLFEADKDEKRPEPPQRQP